ncbi:hypothetical protein ACSHT2_34075 [Bradyrhizobium sp. PUT101]|uniref:hypothetical protein n=1 Tax=Bradyrhizobium sp. PUT101 TaxID=3447427 RepID=UPI003F86F251
MKVSINRIPQRVLSVALSFRGKFTTEDFISRFTARFPNTWRWLVLSYGWPGKNAGKHYTAASRVAHMLIAHANRGRIKRVGYVKSSVNWGSPVVLQFRA